MMRKALLVAAAGMLMGATFGVPASAAYIAPVTLDTATHNNIENAAMVTKTTVVKRKKGRKTTTRRTTTKRWVYDRHRNGNRFRHRQGRYTHYYQGYYYERPWWTIGIPGVNLCIGC